MQKPTTFRTLIEALGGVKDFAHQLGCSEFAAKKMRDRSSIGSDHWPELAKVARAKAKVETLRERQALLVFLLEHDLLA